MTVILVTGKTVRSAAPVERSRDWLGIDYRGMPRTREWACICNEAGAEDVVVVVCHEEEPSRAELEHWRAWYGQAGHVLQVYSRA